MIAYVTSRGDLISSSKNAGILKNIFTETMARTSGRATDNGNIEGSFRMRDNHVTYIAHISATKDPRVYAIAAVTMLSWMGRNDFNIMKLAFAGTLGMVISLIGLFLLRGSVIVPLQALSSQVNTLKWGSEAPDLGGGGSVLMMQVEEISSLKKALTDLANRMIDKDALEKRYVGDIIKAQEDERSRIAQDIHDGPIQVVSALIQRIQMLNITSPDLPGDAARQLATAEDVAQDLVDDLRGVCDSLVPPWVSLGIVSCIEESARRFERQHSIMVNTNVDQELDLPQEKTLAIFRILQEAISNAARHGGASEVNVETVKCDGGRMVECRISDNGRGFTPDTETVNVLVQEGRRGLAGMKRRVELLGGEFDLWSEPGKGTIITVRI
jgi:signal transduction histidine kinase